MRWSWAIISLLICLTACDGQRGNTPVPRRTAYPRAYEYDSVYHALSNLPVNININSQAAVTTERRDDGSVWLNVHYPHYDATIYCTITPVDPTSADAVIDNRMQRIDLNIGSASSKRTTFENSDGYFSSIEQAPSAITTPVQFLSVNTRNPRWVVSGTVFFDNAQSITSVDSVSPIVSTLYRDVEVMLKSLSDK